MKPVQELKVDSLATYIYENRNQLGIAAAEDSIEYTKKLLSEKERVRIVFAAAPSQNEFLSELEKAEIDWSRIDAFHMDEYIGLPSGAPQTFGSYLRKHIFDKVPFGSVNIIDPSNEGAKSECYRYTKLLRQSAIDIVFMGIGENGHIAFNDPPVADFNDPEYVKVVDLEEPCRMQQVHDGCFPSIESVPKTAITLTIPALLSAGYLSVCVPGKTKALAVKNTLRSDISTKCPATILRNHPQVKLYVDRDSASLL